MSEVNISKYKEHVLNGDPCWCEPEVEVVYDDDTGEEVGTITVHREVH